MSKPMRPRYSSTAGVFERRGNPWMTHREGVKDFDRNPDHEDPEYDFDYRFHGAGNFEGKPKVAAEHKETRTQRPSKPEVDFQRQKASIVRKMRISLAASQADTVKVPEALARFHPCPGCREARCFAARGGLGLCAYPLGRRK